MNTRNASPPIAEQIKHHFESFNVACSISEEDTVICQFHTSTITWQCHCLPLSEPFPRVLILHVAPVKVSRQRRRHCAELLNAINHRLAHACFEMDPEDGEVRLREVYVIHEGQLHVDRFQLVMACACLAFEHGMRAVLAVASGMPPWKALPLIEEEVSKGDDLPPLSGDQLQLN